MRGQVRDDRSITVFVKGEGMPRRLEPSPLGPLLLTASPEGLLAVEFVGTEGTQATLEVPTLHAELRTDPCSERHLAAAAQQLAEFFAGRRQGFDLELDIRRGTSFDQRVWRHLSQIPFGGTVSYGELAQAIQVPKASRAVGRACGRNPLPIILPCHRVLATGGKLGGYSAGLKRKAFLLEFEASFAAIGRSGRAKRPPTSVAKVRTRVGRDSSLDPEGRPAPDQNRRAGPQASAP